MNWTFLSWLVAFILQIALFGRCMYSMVCLEDLAQDFINPYDLCTKLNKFVVLEVAAQLTLTALLVFTGKWFTGIIHVGLSVYLLRLYATKQLQLDPTDVYKNLPRIKKQRWILFGTHIFCFLVISFRVIESAVYTILTPEGRDTAKKSYGQFKRIPDMH